jgi:UDP-2-acetamido-3-amino-2,3-dideoxy-glucuronate N-acetyltransferase
MNYFAHSSAIVEANCRIGAGTKIWHFCHIMGGSEIGIKCILGQNVFVASGVVIGDGVKIQNNVSLYTGVICEDDVFIGPSAVFTNVVNPRSFVERKQEFRETLVQKGASIGANATIVCGVRIGRYALIGAGAVVVKDVPDYALVVGNPAHLTGWVSRHGFRLVFNAAGKATCPETGEGYVLENGIVRALPG